MTEENCELGYHVITKEENDENFFLVTMPKTKMT